MRPTAANVLSFLALFVALGGTSYAAVTITGRNVKNSSLTGADVRNSSLTTSDVKNHSLLTRDFKPGQLPAGPKGEPGPRGLQGGEGPKGAIGAIGAPGISGRHQVDGTSAFDSTTQKSVIAACPPGTTVIGGGAFVNASGAVALKTSVAVADGNAWSATAFETAADAENWNVDARAICAKVAP